MSHEAQAAEWRPDQRWETRIVRTKDGVVESPIWVPIPVGQKPEWDQYQEYRRIS